ncbi:hypothetical protein BMS3Abin05_00309 [bacterium BMS3Abin05]|nr:hypothetical protein BMS3Abin05_00309 [bacterium BMS3Abin05]
MKANGLNLKKAVYPSLFLLLFFIFPNRAVQAKSYRFTKVSIQAQLLPDGSMRVEEVRTFKFTGNYRFAYRTFPAKGSVKFTDFGVSEGGVFYRLSQSGKPGTYQINPQNGKIEVKWFYKARNQTKTFTIHYRVENAVRRHEDAAVLYFQFISKEWNKLSHNVSIVLKPPVRLSRSSVKEWLHGPLWAVSKTEEDGTIRADCVRLPKHTILELRVLYPPDSFPNVPLSPGLVSDRIMAEEAVWAKKANRRREIAVQKEVLQHKRRAVGKWVVLGIGFLGLWGWWLLYQKYGKRPSVPLIHKLSSDIPEKIPPVLVGYLMNHGEIYGNALLGTILDLAGRKILNVREESEIKKTLFGKRRTKSHYFLDLNATEFERQKTALADFERNLITFIFDDLAQGEPSIAMVSIQKQRRKFLKFFREWKKAVKTIGDQKNWFDKESKRGLYYSLAVALFLFVLTIPAGFLIGSWAIILGGAGLIVLGLSFIIPHRTESGEKLARRWKALKNYLQKYEFLKGDHTEFLQNINAYLVYSIVLGISQKSLKKLAASIPAEDYQSYFGWYIYHGSGAFSPETFGASFSAMIAATGSTLSSASGAGGGASAGGGGASSGGGGAG